MRSLDIFVSSANCASRAGVDQGCTFKPPVKIGVPPWCPFACSCQRSLSCCTSSRPRLRSVESTALGRLIGEKLDLLLGKRVANSDIHHRSEERRLADQWMRIAMAAVQRNVQNITLRHN